MFNLTFYLILIGILTAFYHWVPRSYTDNGNPNRTVHLNRSDDGYGLAINAWHAISEVSLAEYRILEPHNKFRNSEPKH